MVEKVDEMDKKITTKEIDIVENIQELITKNPDVEFPEKKLEDLVMNSKKGNILEITMSIGSPIKIINVEVVNEEFFEKNLFI